MKGGPFKLVQLIKSSVAWLVTHFQLISKTILFWAISGFIDWAHFSKNQYVHVVHIAYFKSAVLFCRHLYMLDINHIPAKPPRRASYSPSQS